VDDVIKWLLTVGGPIGALAGLIFMAYRRDFLRERGNSVEEKKVLIAIVERSVSCQERLSASLDRLSESIDRTDQERSRQLSDIVRLLMKKPAEL